MYQNHISSELPRKPQIRIFIHTHLNDINHTTYKVQPEDFTHQSKQKLEEYLPASLFMLCLH